MNKITLAVISIILLLTTINAQNINKTTANFTPNQIFLQEITIRGDGHVAPETSFISHAGSVYSLNSDMSNYSLIIQRNNIIFKGNGHTINGTQANPNHEPVNTGLILDHVTNVTVTNLSISGFNENMMSIILKDSFNCTLKKTNIQSITLQAGGFNMLKQSAVNWSAYLESSVNNTLTENVLNRLVTYNSDNNLVTENNVTKIILQFCERNRYYRNSFLFSTNNSFYYQSDKENFFDNGSVGNYWSNYLTKFPIASEIDGSGIGDTHYEINRDYEAGVFGHVLDRYPLIQPITRETVFPTSLPSPSIAPILTFNQKSIFVVLSALIAVLVGIGLLIYFKRQHKTV